jgi:hypothetical protein
MNGIIIMWPKRKILLLSFILELSYILKLLINNPVVKEQTGWQENILFIKAFFPR